MTKKQKKSSRKRMTVGRTFLKSVVNVGSKLGVGRARLLRETLSTQVDVKDVDSE